MLVVIVLLILWIYYSGGGTLRTRKLKKRIEELKGKNKALKETNEALRSGLSSSSERYARPVNRISQLIEELVRVKEYIMGSKTAKKLLEDKYGDETGQELVRKILSSVKNVSSPLKRRLAHEILVGDIGRDILKSLEEGKSVSDASAEAGVPVRVGKERIRLLKETGYLDSRLNLTDWGGEVLEV